MKIGFIGCGHMGGSIAISLSDNNELFLYDLDCNRITNLLTKLNNAHNSSIEEILNKCKYVFLGVKPTDLTSLLNSIKDIKTNCIFVSMAAGYSLKEIQDIIKNNEIIRIMPNTPIAVKKGIVFVTSNNASKETLNEFTSIMSNVSIVYPIKETMMDAGSVIGGSGPAYVDFFIDALIKSAINLGFDSNDASKLVNQMIEGTLLLNKTSSKSVIELGKEVCSPGGSTIEGVNVLLNDGLYELVNKALLASYNKNKNMK